VKRWLATQFAPLLDPEHMWVLFYFTGSMSWFVTGNPLAAYPPFLAGLAVSFAARRRRKRAEKIGP